MAVGCMVILDFLQLYLTQSLWTIHFVCLTQKCDYYSHRSYTVKDKWLWNTQLHKRNIVIRKNTRQLKNRVFVEPTPIYPMARGVPRLDGAQDKKQVRHPHVRT